MSIDYNFEKLLNRHSILFESKRVSVSKLFGLMICGKYVIFESLIDSGRKYRNYTRNLSLVMCILQDSDYNYTFLGIKCQDRISVEGNLR